MKICFIAAGSISWASSRYRAYWVAEALREMGHDATAVQYSDIMQPSPPDGIMDYDVYIFQKTVDIGLVQAMRENEQRVYWDLCDPSWWWQPKECKEIALLMDGQACSTQALADDFNQWSGWSGNTTFFIPDRLKLSHYHTQRKHTAVSPVRFIWYGIAANRVALWAAKANLERLVANGHKIELTIFDDRPDIPFKFSEAFPIYHTQWTLESEVDVISSHDIALLPKYPGDWGDVKSDNKRATAALCGLATSDGTCYSYIEGLVKYPINRDILYDGERHDVKQSALEWLKVLGA